MHQPAATPRRSIYYDYRVFDAAPPPAVPATVPALVVGAGPIGLVTALGLAQQGVRCVVLEAERQVSEGSRAIVFTRRSMEILQQAGASEAIVQMALPWRHGNSFYRGQRVFRMEAPHSDDERFAPMNNLQQQYVEQFLIDAVAAQPLITLRWGHQVTAVLRNDEVGAELAIDTPHGAYTQAAQWVVAADGARSTLRQLCGMKLEGAAHQGPEADEIRRPPFGLQAECPSPATRERAGAHSVRAQPPEGGESSGQATLTHEGRFVIADIRVDLPLPTERLAFFDPPWNPGNTVLMHREPHGIWRIDYQLPPGESPEQALAPVSMKARIDAQLAMIGHAGAAWEMDWSSVYSARALTLPDYVHQRIAFVGDAAHLLPIFGVRGANTGLQDAQNLAWKLGATLQGRAGPGLMASYSAERVAAAREIIDEAGKSTRFMTPPTHGFHLLRDAVLSLSLTQDFVRPLYHWRTSRPHEYHHSALNAADDGDPQFEGGPANGAPLPNIRLGNGDYLLDHLCGAAAGHFSLLLFGDALPADLAAVVDAWRARGLPLQVLLIGADAAARRAALPSGATALIADADQRLRQRLAVPQAGGAYLLRPDQHVCGRWLNLHASALDAALRRALAQP